eukprot:GHVH01001534.1.p1 GENE.GHVH01001534.1~~GHVH01001534.1.p1  ORF type:complete len:262 (+),score=32.75 GHVH01001534.1:92-877(+)
MSFCCRGPHGLSLADSLTNVRSPHTQILADSGLNEKTLKKILTRAQSDYESHGYVRINENRLEPDIDAGAEFICLKDKSTSYEIVRKIGHGNSGIVFECVPDNGIDAGRVMALKVMRLDDKPIISNNLSNGFLREIYIHDYIATRDPMNKAKVVRFEKVILGGTKRSFIGALSVLGHKSLSSFLKGDTLLSVPLIKQLLEKILMSLTVLQEIGVTHSDLKCGNILFDAPVEPVIRKLTPGRKALIQSDPSCIRCGSRGNVS